MAQHLFVLRLLSALLRGILDFFRLTSSLALAIIINFTTLATADYIMLVTYLAFFLPYRWG